MGALTPTRLAIAHRGVHRGRPPARGASRATVAPLERRSAPPRSLLPRGTVASLRRIAAPARTQHARQEQPMKKLLVSLLAAAPAAWSVDASHSQVGFAVKHLVISTVRGEFTKYAGIAQLDDADPAKSTVEVTIDVNSLDTRVADRDGHLKSPDFFDTAKYPTITFKSTKVMVGYFAVSKKSGDLRWPSRSATRVSRLFTSIVTSTVDFAGSASSSCAMPAYFVNSPRTVEMTRCV